MKKLMIVILLGALLVGAGAWSWDAYFADPPDPNTLVLSGNIEAHESVVSFQQIQSRIVDLPIDEGQFLEAGALLAKVDDAVYRQQVAIDESALETQKEQLLSAQQSLVAAQANLQSADADAAQKKLDYDHYEALWSAQVTSQNSRDLAKTAYKQSAAAVAGDQAMVRGAEENVKVAEDNVRRAEEDLRMAQITLGYTVLRAPFSGTVSVRDTELGEVMAPGAPVVTMADLEHVWLRAYIDETELGRIHWGQQAIVTTDSFPGREFHGHISFLSPEAEFTPKSVETHKERVTLVYRVKIDLDNPQYLLKPGMPADATIKLTPLVAQN
jgi:HlyD family secretion protein